MDTQLPPEPSAQEQVQQRFQQNQQEVDRAFHALALGNAVARLNNGLTFEDTPTDPRTDVAGRPSELDPFLNAHSSYVISRLREIGLEKTQIQHVLDTFLNQNLDLRKCARTYHHMEQVEKEFTPQLKTYELDLSTKQKLYYKKPIDIAALLLSDPNVQNDFDFAWNYNGGCIEEAHHTDGWLDLLAHFWDFRGKGFRPLHYYLYTDGFNQLRQKRSDGVGVYFRFAGDRKRRVFLLCVVPPGANINECLKPIAEDLAKFEKGFACMYAPTNQYEGFYGGLFQQTADHVEAASGAGVKNARARRACRYCDILLALVHLTRAMLVRRKAGGPPVLRDPQHFLDTLEEVRRLRSLGHGHQKTADDLLTETGYLEELPVMFHLESAKREWFRKFNICNLHGILLGVVKRFLVNVGNVMGKAKCQEINARLRALPHVPGVAHLKNGIFRFPKGKKITTQPLVGVEYEAFLQVSMVVLRGDFFPDAFMHAWVHLLKLHFMLVTRPFERAEAAKWVRVCVETLEAVLRAFASVKGLDGKLMFSVNFIYSHTLRDHYIMQVLWLGPPGLQNTQVWEKHHQVVKSYAESASKKELYQSIMNMYDHRVGWGFVRHMPEMETYQALHSANRKVDGGNNKYNMIGPGKERTQISPTDLYYLRKLGIVMVKDVIIKVRTYRGFRISTDHAVHTGDWVRLGEPTMHPSADAYAQGIRFGIVKRAFTVILGQEVGDDRHVEHVLELEEWKINRPYKDGVHVLRRSKAVFSRTEDVSARIHVFPDPHEQGIMLLNHWITGRHW